ncbi:hypothetical protein D3C87_1505260 [compost metagenome]
MHMAGKPDALDGGQLRGMVLFEPVHCIERRIPPIGRVLLGPAGTRAHRLDGGRRCIAQGSAVLIDQQRLDAGGADINTQKGHEARTS